MCVSDNERACACTFDVIKRAPARKRQRGKKRRETGSGRRRERESETRRHGTYTRSRGEGGAENEGTKTREDGEDPPLGTIERDRSTLDLVATDDDDDDDMGIRAIAVRVVVEADGDPPLTSRRSESAAVGRRHNLPLRSFLLGPPRRATSSSRAVKCTL